MKLLRRLAAVGLAYFAAAGLALAQIQNPGGAFYVSKAQVPAYWVFYTALTPATSATDLVVLTGSATKTVRVLRWVCWGTATAAGNTVVTANVHNVADTGGTPVTAAKYSQLDQADAAPTATWAAYSANPTIPTQTAGALGSVTVMPMPLYITVTGATPASITVTYDSTASEAKPVVLRGVAQQFALNLGGVTQPSGTSLNCGVGWTEFGS